MCLFLLPFLNTRFLSEVSLQMAGSGFVSLVCIIFFLFHQKKLSEQSFNVAGILGYYTLDSLLSTPVRCCHSTEVILVKDTGDLQMAGFGVVIIVLFITAAFKTVGHRCLLRILFLLGFGVHSLFWVSSSSSVVTLQFSFLASLLSSTPDMDQPFLHCSLVSPGGEWYLETTVWVPGVLTVPELDIASSSFIG